MQKFLYLRSIRTFAITPDIVLLINRKDEATRSGISWLP